METALSSYENSGIHTDSDRKLSHLEYANDVVQLSEYSRKLQVFMDYLNESVIALGIRFAPSKCKILTELD